MVIALLAVALLLLVLLYRYLPNKRVFWWFSLVLLASGAFVYTAYQPPPVPTISELERTRILAEQEVFAAWYEDYKRQIDGLDRNWSRYHQILARLNDEEIGVEAAYDRLDLLEADASASVNAIARMSPPTSLSEECQGQVNSLLAKTRDYAARQYRAISLSKSIMDPDSPIGYDEQRRRLHEVMIRESPPGLFTAEEIYAIRNMLTVPEQTATAVSEHKA